MLDRIADRLGRQERHRKTGRKRLGDGAGDALGYDRIGLEGQMRAVLFMGAERLHGDPVAPLRRIEPVIIVFPFSGGEHHAVKLLAR